MVVLWAAAFTAQANPIGFSVRSNVDDHLYSIDLVTGLTTDLGLVGFGDAEGLAFVGSTLYAIGGTVDEFWNITLPPGSLVGNTGARRGIDAGLDFNLSDGKMYNINSDVTASNLYEINILLGTASLIGTSAFFGDGLAIDGVGNAFTSDAIFADGLYGVNLGNGALTFIGGFGLGNISQQSGLSFDNTGQLWMMFSDGSIYTVDSSNGAATFSAQATLADGSSIGGFEGLGINPIPEPGAALLFGVGLLVVIRSLRRKA